MPSLVLTWAQRFKRVFNIDIETCPDCGGAVKVIACIDDVVVKQKILTHLQEKAASAATGLLPSVRAGNILLRSGKKRDERLFNNHGLAGKVLLFYLYAA